MQLIQAHAGAMQLGLAIAFPICGRRDVSHPDEENTARERREEELGQAVMAYLQEHPHASDTLQGIAEWWVMRRQVRVELAALERVLRHLTDDGLLEEIGSGASRRYRLMFRRPQ